ncbi:ac150-like protein [Peridroma alphabaculovirus]|uniref:Ac150-like protein n=1 Tax=Peridroma alphabaculovirus TaxID=1346829 RepID=A0A068LMM0_9ABAC|nr:ac150-like protein [Peridroma alphabaculovirus]AIE47786.1 ac150-like protein [Peridroma alphabaculovirus]
MSPLKWTLVAIVIFFVLVALGFLFNPNDVLRAGPTCDTYHYKRELRRCKHKHEFDFYSQKCVPVGEEGCTAAANPTTITANEMHCGGGKLYQRHPEQPCQVLRNCSTNRPIVAPEGQCLSLVNNSWRYVECFDLPGCRHLDVVHIPTHLPVDAIEANQVVCPFADNARYRHVAFNPCVQAWECEVQRPHSCMGKHMCADASASSLNTLCVPCEQYERCRYRLAYTPLNDIANGITELDDSEEEAKAADLG